MSSESVKASKHVVGEALPNNPLTAINKKSCLLGGGECDSNHTSKEAANSEDNSIKSVGLKLTALRLCGHWIEDRPTKFNVSKTSGAAAASSYSADAEDQRLTKMTGVSLRHRDTSRTRPS